MIYFDNAATTLQKPPTVLNSLFNLTQKCGNAGRSAHFYGMLSSDVLFRTRRTICDFFNFNKPENVVFTYNATYALNMAIKGFITEPCSVLISNFEHNSTVRPLMSLDGVTVKIVSSSVYENEELLKNFKRSIDSETKFAVINHVSNVFGYVLPIKEIDEICAQHNIKLILDISQSAGIIPIDLSSFKSLIAVCMPAHKSLYGVMGLGILILIDQGVEKTIIEGGTGSLSSSIYQPSFLPDMLEAGTPNVPAIGALHFGIEYLNRQKDVNLKLFNLAKYFSNEMSRLDDTFVYFKNNIELQSGVVAFKNNNFDDEHIAAYLSKNNICVRSGYHCAPLAHLSVNSDGLVRASFSTFNNFSEIEKFIDIYRDIK